jgi:hypothetical protein
MLPPGISTTPTTRGPRRFECPTCDHPVDDPMKSGVVGWLNSNLKRPE